MANRLAGETSPYLQQHAGNPVNWWPWGPEALAEAKATDRPILLSVGYAACHWCHVMAHESFENNAIAQRMNDAFVNIKIDREERPDLDSIYQHALGMMGQHGGWPLTMFLTPGGEPFWGGTYFPPFSRYGRPGFPDVLKAVADTWATQREKVRENVIALREGLEEQARSPGPGTISLDLINQGARQILRAVDTVNGGLQGAPKFPQPGLFEFLWRTSRRTGDTVLHDAVTLTLDRMSHGGIYDHLGGGTMRYSTDEEWLVPHFEKMLYDNAQLIDLLTMVWQDTRNPLYAQRVNETAEWTLREMMAERGAFAATLDADSDGGEGRFYTWTASEIDRLLDPETASFFKQAYDVRPAGNWEGVSILQRNHQPQPVGIEDTLADARAVLWRDRESRPRPGRDDKILADWNGMMIAALANAGFVFSMPRWIDAAQVAFATIATQMALPGGRLAHAMRFGKMKAIGLVDDLAHMARAALVLYEVTGDPAYLEKAQLWVQAADDYHWDKVEGGYFQPADDATDVVVRPKPIHDSAVPAANGIMAQVLARLWLLTGEPHYNARAAATIDAFSALIRDQFPNLTSLLGAFEQLANPLQVVIAGPRADDDTRALLRAVAETSAPTRVLQFADNASLPDHHPAHGKHPVEGQPAAYVCKGAVCSAPITDAGMLRDALLSR